MILLNKNPKPCESEKMQQTYSGFLECDDYEKKVSPRKDSLDSDIIAYYAVLRRVPSDLNIDLSGKNLKVIKFVSNNENLEVTDMQEIIEASNFKISKIKKGIVDCELMFFNTNSKYSLYEGNNIPNFLDSKKVGGIDVEIKNRLYYNTEIEIEVMNYITFFKKFKNEQKFVVYVENIKNLLENQINTILQEKTVEYAENFKGNEFIKNKANLLNEINKGFLEKKFIDKNGDTKSLSDLYGLRLTARFINPELNY